MTSSHPLPLAAALCGLLLGMLLVGNGVRAQSTLPQMLCNRPTPISTADSGRLHIAVDALAFLRDAECFNPTSLGYTAIGSRISPTLQYTFSRHADIEIGLLTELLAGDQGISLMRPRATLRCQPFENNLLQVVMGTLGGSGRHDVPPALLDPERLFLPTHTFLEEGVQLITHTRHWQSDTWINWEELLMPWTAAQERFTLGSHHELHLPLGANGKKARWQLDMPLTFIGSHRGGQISTLDTCIESRFNESIGLRLNLRSTDQSTTASLSATLFNYHMASGKATAYVPYTSGQALQATLAIDYTSVAPNATSPYRLQGSASYWYGQHFLSARGDGHYASQCDYALHPETVLPTRSILTLNATAEIAFGECQLGADITAWHDLLQHSTDVAFGLYLRYCWRKRLL